EFFEKRIRPVLTEKCYKCHSTRAEKIKGGLLLDSRSGWVKGGDSGPVIVPGDPEKSRLIHAVRYTDSNLQMPPKEILPSAQIVDLATWVRMGAPDPRVRTGPSGTTPQSGRDRCLPGGQLRGRVCESCGSIAGDAAVWGTLGSALA